MKGEISLTLVEIVTNNNKNLKHSNHYCKDIAKLPTRKR